MHNDADSSVHSDCLKNTAQVADRPRRGGGTVGHVVERLDGDVAAIAVLFQRGDQRREALLALARGPGDCGR
jgi:hypothetical protein